ncbi:MAG TPA: M57 family metalloprotease [Longimicrobium sp.]
MSARRTRLAAGAVAALFLAACGDQRSPVAPADEVPAADLAALRTLGFSDAGVVDHGDYYVVEGDVEVSKSTLRATPSMQPARRIVLRGDVAAMINPPVTGATRGWSWHAPRLSAAPGDPRMQWQTWAIVSASRARTIHVDLSAIASSTDWQDAARSALQNWTNILGSAVTMVEGGGADITIRFENLNDTTEIARASWPRDATGGGPGPLIRINTYFLNGLSVSQMERAITHELGHTIGFRHSNWQARGETNGDPGAVRIGDTPATDAASVMNAVNTFWNGFSPNDERAAIILYPDTTQVTVTNSAGQPFLSWNALTGATSYGVMVVWQGEESWTDPNDRENSYTTWVVDGMELVSSTTATTFLDTVTPWTGTSTCWRTSSTDPAWSGGEKTSSYWVSAAFQNGTTNTSVVAPVCQSN